MGKQKWAIVLAACVVLAVVVVMLSAGYGRGLRRGRRAPPSLPGKEAGVAGYVGRVMALEEMRPYINRAYQPDPDAPLVYVDFTTGSSDSVIKEAVRLITLGVHRNSTTGAATVVGQYHGYRVAEGHYNLVDGSAEVTILP